VGVRDRHPLGRRSGLVKLGQPDPRDGGEGGKQPRQCRKGTVLPDVSVRLARPEGIRSGTRFKLRKSCTGSNLAD
jgi:hypothetical protein